MITILFIVAFISLTALTASAQDDPKLRSDGTYSTHNYKHPNKAAAARRWSAKQGVPVTVPATGRVANYKQPVPGQVPTGGITVPHTPIDDAQRNYKNQRVNVRRSTVQPDTGVINRPLRQANPGVD